MKQTLADGGFTMGTWVMQSRSPAVIRLIANAGFDFVFIDTEHSDFSTETVHTFCDVARASDLVPIVRAYDTNAHLANRIQDLGAMGLMYHDVTSREQVDEILRAMTYPPAGYRGSTSWGAPMDYSTSTDGAAIRAQVDDNAMLVVQIESAEGVANMDAILTGGGVDLVEVGRGDLSSSLGHPLQARHPEVMSALDDVIAVCDKHGVAVGVNAQSVEDATDLVDRGVRSIAFSNDRRILQLAYQEAITTVGAHAVSVFGTAQGGAGSDG
ncbi:MAG: aldolase/citrate lyase family protein [Nocardioides sp.]